jgi:hypothetical protein
MRLAIGDTRYLIFDLLPHVGGCRMLEAAARDRLPRATSARVTEMGKRTGFIVVGPTVR